MNTEYKEPKPIPLISELIESFDNGEFKDNEEGWVRYYPTESHKKGGEEFSWLMPIQDIKKWAQLHKDLNQ